MAEQQLQPQQLSELPFVGILGFAIFYSMFRTQQEMHNKKSLSSGVGSRVHQASSLLGPHHCRKCLKVEGCA